MPKLVIDFDNEILGARVITETPSGATEEKYVSIADIKDLFKDEGSDTGYLPKGTLRHSTLAGGAEAIMVLVPPHITHLNIDEVRYPNLAGGRDVPIPYTVLGGYIKQHRLVYSVCGCLKYNPVISNWNTSNIPITYELMRQNNDPASTTICQFPYGNVYSGEHKICWGNVVLPELRTLKDFDKIVTLFLEAEANGDLFYTNSGMGFDSFVEHMSGKTALSNEDFYETTISLEDLWRSLINRGRNY